MSGDRSDCAMSWFSSCIDIEPLLCGEEGISIYKCIYCSSDGSNSSARAGPICSETLYESMP